MSVQAQFRAPSKAAMIRAMVAQGATADEIVRATGASLHHVYEVRSQARRTGEKVAPHRELVSVWKRLSGRAQGRLRREAQDRGLAPSALAAQIIETVVNEGLVQAVLDDEVDA